jgi:hypothetical protein
LGTFNIIHQITQNSYDRKDEQRVRALSKSCIREFYDEHFISSKEEREGVGFAKKCFSRWTILKSWKDDLASLQSTSLCDSSIRCDAIRLRSPRPISGLFDEAERCQLSMVNMDEIAELICSNAES